MDLGSGIGLAGMAVSGAAVLITTIKTRSATAISRTSGIYNSAFPRAMTCLECGALKTKIDELGKGLTRVEARMDKSFETLYDKLDFGDHK